MENNAEWWAEVIERALTRLDPDGRYRGGKRRPRTRAEYEDVKTIRKLQNELRGLSAAMVKANEKTA